MKTIIKIMSLFITASLILVSCNSDEASGITAVDYTNVNITLVAAQNDVTISESDMTGDVSYQITASIPEPQTLDYVVNFEQKGTAIEGFDFDVERIIIRAGNTSASTNVVVHKTGDLEEEDDTISLVAVSEGTTSNIVTFAFNATITDDYTNEDLFMTIEWCSDFKYEFTLGDLSGNYGEKIDLDIYLFDEATNDMVGYAATADCPEVLEFGSLPDGSYVAVVFVWDNALASLGVGANVPLNVSYEQEYFIEKTEFPHNLTLSSDAAYDTNSAGVPLGPLARIVKVGHEYTITTP